MSLEVKVHLKKDDVFEADTVYSGVKVLMDRKKENYAPSGPNPSELFLTSLGGCIGVYAKRYLDRHNIPFRRMEIDVRGEFSSDTPRRMVDIKVSLRTDADLKGKEEIFLRFISNCPVHNTITHTEEVDIRVESLTNN